MLIVVSCNKLRTISASFELRLECETVSSCDSHLSSGPCLLASRETRNEQVEIGDSHEINVEGNHDDLFNILIRSFPYLSREIKHLYEGYVSASMRIER